MREINRHIIHCSATSNDLDIGAKEIKGMHLANGWSDCGYHFIIRRNGVIEHGRPCERMGAHVKGYNEDSIGTCLIGDDKFTLQQIVSLIKLDKELKHLYNKNMTTHGHNEFTNKKTCPNFDVKYLFEFVKKTIK